MLFVISSITILYASTSGHTEYVVSVLSNLLHKKESNISIEMLRCEQAKPEDLTRSDLLILASGTWNIGGVEGQLNPLLHTFLLKDSKNINLKEKPVCIIALGDDRYYYTSRASEHLRNFIQSNNGEVFGYPLTIINEPYGQEDRIEKWADKLISLIKE